MNDGQADPHYQRGMEAMEARDLTRAICEFRLAIKFNSQHAEAYPLCQDDGSFDIEGVRIYKKVKLLELPTSEAVDALCESSYRRVYAVT